ncbi:hypothetical protein BY996DRAFT_4576748 [Phakopsora pachyrhizi]|uniref:Mediator of RNA polymerase II transcription subunit 12 n=1 Tax=Phakopsora pachyrhizi TaxID=170000 RepID=A0AAV0BGD8_PHAPC|nr:hypothetical protein BY996DRAFT_4576748 [Phakopsora pachyrhizi]CAH7686244.1 hypothetical protein PPACK8108_LOCUS20866 [Phakopsora pachyrhizi]
MPPLTNQVISNSSRILNNSQPTAVTTPTTPTPTTPATVPVPSSTLPPSDSDFQRCGLVPYNLRPPSWRLPIIRSNSTEGVYPGLHPTHLGQQEDAITKSLIQNGFNARTLVGTEAFSAHQMIYKKLNDDTGFNNSSAALSALIEARRRFCAHDSHNTRSTIKVPGRVTLNDQKRENWLRDLADGSVPLLKLSKNVPHGFKGEKLLEMLVNRRIDATRATWYIRLIGHNEVNFQRQRNDLSHIRHTLAFTTDVCQFLQKQLAEVTVPHLNLSTTSLITNSSRLAAMHVRSKPRSSTLSDPETRKAWLGRWSHRQVQRLHYESLIDQPTFFKWLVDQLKLANLAQVNFFLDVHRFMFERFCLSSNLVRGFVEACLTQIRSISSLTMTSYLSELDRALRLAIQGSFIFCPDNFVWPDLWISNKVLLENIILSSTSLLNNRHEAVKQNIKSNELKEVLRNDLFAVNWRVSELVGEVGLGTGIVRNTFTRRTHLVEILDNCTDYSDFPKLYYKYFLNPTGPNHTVIPLKDKLEVLLSWSTTPLRMSDKRIYPTTYALAHVKRDRKKNDDEFQNILVGWLEQIEAIQSGDLLVRLFSELSKRSIFSYGAYVQRMVAKGDTEHDILAGKASGLQALLSEWMPLASAFKASGTRNAHLKRSPGRDAARNGLMLVLSDISGALAAADYVKLLSAIQRRLDVAHPNSANRKILAEILPDSLVRIITELLSFNPSTAGLPFNQSNHSPINLVSALLTWGIQILESSKSYDALLDTISRVSQIDLGRIEATGSDDSGIKRFFRSTYCYLQLLCIIILNSRVIFSIHLQLVDLISRLFTIHVQLRRLIPASSSIDRSFVRYLRTLAQESNLTDSHIIEVLDREVHSNLEGDITISEMNLGESPSSLTKDILALISNPSAEEASRLVSKYHERYSHDPQWGPTLWNSLVAAIKILNLEQSSSIPTDQKDRVQLDYWVYARSTILELCEDLDFLYHGGLVGCIFQIPAIRHPDSEGEQLLARFSATTDSMAAMMMSEGEEKEEGEEENLSEGIKSALDTFGHNPRILCPALRRLLAELVSLGLLDIQFVLEEYVLRPLGDDIPQSLTNALGPNGSNSPLSSSQRAQQKFYVIEVCKQMEEVCALFGDMLTSEAPSRFIDFDQVDLRETNSSANGFSHPFAKVSRDEMRMKRIDYGFEEYTRLWKLNVERQNWFEQSDAGTAFCSHLLLTVLASKKTVSDLVVEEDAQFDNDNEAEDGFNHSLSRVIELFEKLRMMICQGDFPLRQIIFTQASSFMNPILSFIDSNDLGNNFNTSLVQSVDELIPYPNSTIDLSGSKYPYLESIFKSVCIFNHAARELQFQLHLRLLLSESPPVVNSVKETPFDLNSTLGSLVEVMARRLHLTDSKDASPFFVKDLPPSFAEALIIKLCLYLGISISKLFGPSPTESTPEVARIHHISRCITVLTQSLTQRTCQKNQDATTKVVGGTRDLSFNATVESYVSYWQQLRAGLLSLRARMNESHSTESGSSRRNEFRILRALIHSMRVVLWALPGLNPHLSPLKYSIAIIWIEIAMGGFCDQTTANQIMDIVAFLIFPTTPDDATLTQAVGVFRKSFRWLYQPLMNFENENDLMASTRLKYMLGTSLRGSTCTFQERTKDGAIRFVEERAWEELEKMDMNEPGYVSIDSLKCQTLSQVEPIPESRRPGNCRSKSLNKISDSGGDVEHSFWVKDEFEEEEMKEERGRNRPLTGAVDEEEEGPARGERDSFEHELNTDGLSTLPLHFLRSLCPAKSRLDGEDWLNSCSHQLRHSRIEEEGENEEGEDEEEDDDFGAGERGVGKGPMILTGKGKMAGKASASSGGGKLNQKAFQQKRKTIGSPIPESSGPTLRSTRSTRRRGVTGSSTLSNSSISHGNVKSNLNHTATNCNQINSTGGSSSANTGGIITRRSKRK